MEPIARALVMSVPFRRQGDPDVHIRKRNGRQSGARLYRNRGKAQSGRFQMRRSAATERLRQAGLQCRDRHSRERRQSAESTRPKSGPAAWPSPQLVEHSFGNF